MSYFIGLEIGTFSEPGAIVVVEAILPPHVDTKLHPMWVIQMGRPLPTSRGADGTPLVTFAVREIQRLEPGTSLPVIVERTKALAKMLEKPHLVLNATSIGRAAIELFEQTTSWTEAVVLTAGDSVEYVNGIVRAPKKDLISTAQVLLQTGRLKIARELSLSETLVRELERVRVEAPLGGDPAVTIRMREGPNEDLVLALGLALWSAEGNTPTPPKERPLSDRERFLGDYWKRRRSHGR